MTDAPAAVAECATILLIEDEPSVAAFLRTALERRGYAVVPSSSAAAGLRLLATGQFQGVISDFRTPGVVNGGDVHDWLQRHRPELAARVVFITGDTASGETLALRIFNLLHYGHNGSGTVSRYTAFRIHQLLAVVEKTIGKP